MALLYEFQNRVRAADIYEKKMCVHLGMNNILKNKTSDGYYERFWRKMLIQMLNLGRAASFTEYASKPKETQ